MGVGRLGAVEALAWSVERGEVGDERRGRWAAEAIGAGVSWAAVAEALGVVELEARRRLWRVVADELGPAYLRGLGLEVR